MFSFHLSLFCIFVFFLTEECAYRFLTSDNPDDNSPTGIPTVMEAYRWVNLIFHNNNDDDNNNNNGEHFYSSFLQMCSKGFETLYYPDRPRNIF